MPRAKYYAGYTITTNPPCVAFMPRFCLENFRSTLSALSGLLQQIALNTLLNVGIFNGRKYLYT